MGTVDSLEMAQSIFSQSYPPLSVLHSFNERLYVYMPSTGLGAGNAVVNRRKSLSLLSVYSSISFGGMWYYNTEIL